jgi:hypothetical protein
MKESMVTGGFEDSSIRVFEGWISEIKKAAKQD